MEQFSLEKWLENPSYKVLTRRGNPVRIICIDRKHGKDELPIVFLEESNGGEFLLTCRNDGRCDNYDTQYDLFFADEEEELTELQKTLEEDCDCYVNLYNDGKTREELREWIRGWCPRIIDLARKELEEDYYLCAKGDSLWEDGYKNGKQDAGEAKVKELVAEFEKGRQDALKDLPKWKKMPNGIQGNNKLEPTYLIRTDYGFYFTSSCLSQSETNMYIELVELEKLQKDS